MQNQRRGQKMIKTIFRMKIGQVLTKLWELEVFQ